MENIFTKKLDIAAKLPTKGSIDAAGSDLYACISKEIEIPAGETVMIPTGLAMQIPSGYGGFIYARSGLATKNGIRPANCVGVVDADYRGEIKVALHNDSSFPVTIYPEDRIAQIVIAPFLQVNFFEVDHLTDTERGEGGFGSTGTN